MARPKIDPLLSKQRSAADRLKASTEAKLKRGEKRLTVWLDPEAAAALREELGEGPERGAIQGFVNKAILNLAGKK